MAKWWWGWWAGVVVAWALAALTAHARPAGLFVTVVALQGTTDYKGTEVFVDDAVTPALITASNGVVQLDLAPGLHTVIVRHPRYLSSALTLAMSGDLVNATGVTLLGGDTNGDDVVSLPDLITVAAAYGLDLFPPQADINGDGKVNMIDLVMVAGNYGVRAPVPWPGAVHLTPTPTVNPATPSVTPTPTATPIPTKTPPPFSPTGLCVALFQDSNANGRWDDGEPTLVGRTVRLYTTTDPLVPQYALVTYSFTGSETTPKCFPNAGLENGTFRIQLDSPPLGGWGLVYSQPLGPVRVVPNVNNVWEVDVEEGKVVYWSRTGGTPQPTPTLTPLNVCGVVTTFVAPRGGDEGQLTLLGQPTLFIAPGVTLVGQAALRPGVGGCLSGQVSGAGYVVSGAWAVYTPTPSPTP